MQFITDESGDRFITELTEEFRNELDNCDKLPDYESLDADQLKIQDNLEKQAIPLDTSYQTQRHTKMFRIFLSSKGMSDNFEKAPVKILCDYICVCFMLMGEQKLVSYMPRVAQFVLKLLLSIDISGL